MPALNHEYLKNLDGAVYQEIFVENVYDVFGHEVKDKIVIDVGACLGYFSLRCVELGAKQVIAVEAQPTNYSPALVEITQPYPNITAINRAISDVDNKTVYIPSRHSVSTVNSKGQGDPVSTIRLQTILADLPKEDLILKIDCEGSEFNVFMTADREDIRRFNVIYMEVHGNTNENPQWQDTKLIDDKLTAFGFKKVKSVQIYDYPVPGVRVPLPVYTDKWIRLDETPKYSIVIPTARYFDRAFKPCIDAVLNYTSLDDKEIIVVPNGSPQETRDYLEQLIKQYSGKISYLWQDQPVGYVRAVNLGIDQSRGQYIILVDDDLFLLDQPRNFWIEILERAFKEDLTVAASAPDARTDYYHFQDYVKMVLHSNCAMYRADVLRSVGKFDEAYNPGYFSDSDVAMKIQKAGYKCAMATANRQPTVIHPGSGMMAIDFPAYHLSTVQTMNKKTDENLVFRNRKLLIERHGGPRKYSIIVPTYNHCDDLLKPCLESIIQYTDLDQAEIIVVANGCTDNTRNYVESLPDSFRLVWFDEPIGFTKAVNEGIKKARGKYIVILNNDVEMLAQAPNQWLTMLQVPFENNPKLGLTGALKLFDHDVQKEFLVFCCTMIKREVFDKIGLLDEIFNPGYGEDIDFTLRAVAAGYEFLEPCPTTNQHGENVSAHPSWHKSNKTFGTMTEYAGIVKRNREILKQRYKRVTYSIVIPTYNHCEDLLKPCLESIKKYTDLNDVEIIVVANGCIDNTRSYVESLGHPFKLIWSDAALGYTKATNLGIKAAVGKFVVLMNNDIVLLEQAENYWLKLLEQPFADSACGITGPVKFDWDCGGIRYDCMAFWLVMIKREVFDRVGILDEVYSPGMGEDGDFCIRATQAGYTMVSVPNDVTGQFETGIKNFGFPIFHVGNGTFADNNNLKNSVIERNNKLLADRFGAKGPVDQYCIDLNYKSRTTTAFFDDTDSKDEWQREVYEQARKIAKENNYRWILDIGTGSGYKLVKNFPTEEFSTIGMDLPKTCDYLRKTYLDKLWLDFDFDNDSIIPPPLWNLELDLIICSDIIEHLLDPNKIINFIKKLKFKKLIISTPDRLLLEDTFKNFVGGPPMNPSHVREWTYTEFKNYLEKNFKVETQMYSNDHQPTIMAVCNPKENATVLDDNSISDSLQTAFNWCCNHVCDINEHIPTLRKYATECQHITEFGTRDVVSTYGFMAAKPKTLITYDINIPRTIWVADSIAKENNIEFKFMHRDVTQIEIEPTDLLFIDTLHNYTQLKTELKLHADKVRKYILMHDTVSFGLIGEMNDIGLIPAIEEFLETNKNWQVKEHHENNNGLLILERVEMQQTNYPVKYSIVIPSYNHCEDLLKPCVESIKKYTDMSNVEVIVVANGCTDNTKEYMSSLDEHFKMVWLDEPSGYTKSTNEGIKVARGEYVILLNNDTELLPQNTNMWLQMLEDPFLRDPKMGLVGPLMLHDDYADHDSIIFFCVMIKREVFNKIGILDEIFTPGGGEDIDFTVRAAQAGYTFAVAGEFKYNGSTNHGTVPIWHKDNRTLCEMPEYTRWIVKRNGLVNAKRYNKNIKLNLGSGGISYPGFLSVDLYDRRAHIASDITKLDLDDNSVSEILASHVFEHINPYKAMDALREWHRVLRPGGKLVMEMPDIEQLFKNFITADTPKRYGITNAIYGSVNTTDTGNPWDITSPHLFGWWPEAIRNHLSQAGFRNIETMDEKIPHPESNFRVEAVK